MVKNKIIEGNLACIGCRKEFPIIRSVPRFVSMENYTKSFGYQWNLYKYTQLDTFSKASYSEKRFYSETQWTQSGVEGNLILEVGCGNGRFIEICSRNNCQVVGVDMSSAVDAAADLFADRDNVHIVQASIYELPFAAEVFDKCYSIGVIQHTPNPEEAIKKLPRLLKNNGQIALTIYEKKHLTKLCGKYLVRPFTKRINKRLLLKMIQISSPIFFPITELLFRLPVLNKIFKFLIPYANYVEMKELTIKERYNWAMLDTFDMLSPMYDNPMQERTIRKCLADSDIREVKRLPNPGVNVIGAK